VLAAVAALALASLGGTTAGTRVGAAAAGVSMVEPQGDAQKYWPRWRGPSGQGIASGTGYPDVWSPTQNIKWRTVVPGRGNSSPVVWGDRIFLTSAQGASRAFVMAFDRATGKRLWETMVPDKTLEYANTKNGYASPTPSTDGQRVYSVFGNKGVLATDLDGKIVWHKSLGTLSNYQGSAGSPLLYKDRLILYEDHTGGSEGGAFIMALDAATGKTLWRTDREATVGWGTPIAIHAGDRDEIVVSSQKAVTSYDPATGRELWTCRGNMTEVIPTPVVGHGLVFCSSGRIGPTMAIRPGGSGDVTETHVAWKTPKGSPFVPSPLLYGDYLYTVNDMESILTCLEAETGTLMFQGRMGERAKEGFSSSPVGADGKVFFTNDQGETFVLKAGATFELLHVNTLGARVLASPALVDGKWYFRTDRELIAIGS
jgi:outer membrane protein assembly factor BamB